MGLKTKRTKNMETWVRDGKNINVFKTDGLSFKERLSFEFVSEAKKALSDA